MSNVELRWYNVQLRQEERIRINGHMRARSAAEAVETALGVERRWPVSDQGNGARAIDPANPDNWCRALRVEGPRFAVKAHVARLKRSARAIRGKIVGAADEPAAPPPSKRRKAAPVAVEPEKEPVRPRRAKRAEAGAVEEKPVKVARKRKSKSTHRNSRKTAAGKGPKSREAVAVEAAPRRARRAAPIVEEAPAKPSRVRKIAVVAVAEVPKSTKKAPAKRKRRKKSRKAADTKAVAVPKRKEAAVAAPEKATPVRKRKAMAEATPKPVPSKRRKKS